MSNWISAVFALIGLFGSGCAGSQSGGEVGAESEPNGTGGTSSVGRDCVVSSTTSVGWTESTAVGTPEEVFGTVPGTCEAPFVWDGSAWTDALTVEPALGESRITVTVDIDESSARWVESEKAANANPIGGCVPLLQVDATVTLDLPEGPVVSEQQTTLTVFSANWPEGPSIEFSVDAADVGDWVSITTANSDTTGTLDFTVASPQLSCTGKVNLRSETAGEAAVDGADVTVTGIDGGSLASWSNTGCTVGEYPVDLDEPYQGLDLRAAVQQAFGDVQLSGAWEDGGTTTMDLQTSIAAAEVCGSDVEVVVPVDVVADTSDGRVVSLSGFGTVQAVMYDSALMQLELWLSEELVCQSETDLLPYRSADCTSATMVTAQLGFTESFDVVVPTRGELALDVVGRDSSAAGGVAGRVDRLVLSR
jgi:hypothetical protein